MNCSFCALADTENAAVATLRAATANAVRFIAVLLLRACSEMRNGSIPTLMRKGPEPQLLLGDLPQAGEAIGFDDQEEDDQAAEDDRLRVGHHRMRHLD